MTDAGKAHLQLVRVELAKLADLIAEADAALVRTMRTGEAQATPAMRAVVLAADYARVGYQTWVLGGAR